DLLAEGGEDEADAAGARAEQVPVRRVLLRVFLRRDAGAFDEVEDGDGDVAIEPAGDARGLEVAAAFLGMLREVLGRVAAHEREPEGPAGLADDGRPDQDALEEEARERRDAVEDADEGEDVDPGDVVADDEVVAVAPQ